LCEHDIACDYASFRDKTPTSANAANVVDLNDVHRGAMVDSVPLAAVATGDVEKAVRAIKSRSRYIEPAVRATAIPSKA
jgi:hypothetical protein